MELIVITAERFFDGETNALHLLFAHGLERLHVRKPDASFDDTKRFIEDIDAAFHPKIVLHDHYDLTHRFRLKGIHLNRRNRAVNPALYRARGLTVSRSCHSFEEIASCRKAEATDYVFLSPVFDSISKSGYRQRFTPEELSHAHDRGLVNGHVIALGGITAANIASLRSCGFGGVAVLGALWGGVAADRDTDGLLQRFNALMAGTTLSGATSGT
jgi:thiamine-phosphate pyrophosphorylase